MPSPSRAVAKIAPTEIVRMLPRAKRVRFTAGTVILKEGTRAESCFLVLSGRVQISKRMKGSVTYDLAVIRKGDFFGEMAMLSGQSRSATARSLSAVELLEIKRVDFMRLLRAQDPFAARLALQFSSALALRCSRLLRLLAENSTQKKAGPRASIDVRRVLHRVYSLWAV